MHRRRFSCALWVVAAFSTGCRSHTGRDAGAVARGKVDEIARPAARVANNDPCTFTPTRTIGAHASTRGELAIAHVAGHLGLGWPTTSGVAAGVELRDDATVLRAVALEVADAGTSGNETSWSRGAPQLDPRSALTVMTDREELIDESDLRDPGDPAAPRRAEAHCNDLVDPIYYLSARGTPTLALGTMYSCRTISDAPAFVLALATPAVPTPQDLREVRVVARRNPLTQAAWDVDRFGDALWSIPIPAFAADATVPAMHAALQPEALVSVAASGTGYALAISLQHQLYVGWISPQLTAMGGLHRVPAATSAHGAALAWNGHEALLVYVNGEGANSRLYGARVSPLRGAGTPIGLATPVSNIVSPSVAAFGSGEWVVSWVDAGVAHAQPFRTDLNAREPAHDFDSTVAQAAIAARADHYVVAWIEASSGEGQLSIAGARCPSGRYVAPPPTTAFGDEIAPIHGAANAAPAAPVCTVRPHHAFRLRATPSGPPAGPEILSTVLSVTEQGTAQRGNATAYRVRTTDGASGWVFVEPDEVGSGCAR